MLFGQDVEVPCADHAGTGMELTDKCVNITLAVILTPATYTWSITGVDAVGNDSIGERGLRRWWKRTPFKLKLKPGVNLVSIPGMPRGDGGMLDIMLADAPVSTVLTYDGMAAAAGDQPVADGNVKDPETGVFSGDITMIEPARQGVLHNQFAASYTVNVKLEATGGLPAQP